MMPSKRRYQEISSLLHPPAEPGTSPLLAGLCFGRGGIALDRRQLDLMRPARLGLPLDAHTGHGAAPAEWQRDSETTAICVIELSPFRP